MCHSAATKQRDVGLMVFGAIIHLSCASQGYPPRR
jgi:hypothetical protein